MIFTQHHVGNSQIPVLSPEPFSFFSDVYNLVFESSILPYQFIRTIGPSKLGLTIESELISPTTSLNPLLHLDYRIMTIDLDDIQITYLCTHIRISNHDPRSWFQRRTATRNYYGQSILYKTFDCKICRWAIKNMPGEYEITSHAENIHLDIPSDHWDISSKKEALASWWGLLGRAPGPGIKGIDWDRMWEKEDADEKSGRWDGSVSGKGIWSERLPSDMRGQVVILKGTGGVEEELSEWDISVCSMKGGLDMLLNGERIWKPKDKVAWWQRWWRIRDGEEGKDDGGGVEGASQPEGRGKGGEETGGDEGGYGGGHGEAGAESESSSRCTTSTKRGPSTQDTQATETTASAVQTAPSTGNAVSAQSVPSTRNLAPSERAISATPQPLAELTPVVQDTDTSPFFTPTLYDSCSS
ncbi:hypothetical protein EJ08DRAFT_701680 [Tothia fuscella]|uniref:Uncharacterized protein n=1 Tax=Tothia fuscella TaxID=1048955 RepID=A0A9P4TTE3_9PEZI|nr:hypothetical protein EJ08DRAFT_701680 [Tothia fuscella]